MSDTLTDADLTRLTEALAAVHAPPLRYERGSFGERANSVVDAQGNHVVISHLHGRMTDAALTLLAVASEVLPRLLADRERLRAEMERAHGAGAEAMREAMIRYIDAPTAPASSDEIPLSERRGGFGAAAHEYRCGCFDDWSGSGQCAYHSDAGQAKVALVMAIRALSLPEPTP